MRLVLKDEKFCFTVTKAAVPIRRISSGAK
jgi:hypothetical protein